MTVLIIVVTLLILTNIVLSIRKAEYTQQIVEISTGFDQKELLQSRSCPDAVGGNNNSFLKMKYFYSDSCPWCAKEEKVLKKLLREQGHLFSLEWYNVAYCKEIADQHKVGGVPTFAFLTEEDGLQVRYGFIPENDFETFLCSVTGGC